MRQTDDERALLRGLAALYDMGIADLVNLLVRRELLREHIALEQALTAAAVAPH